MHYRKDDSSKAILRGIGLKSTLLKMIDDLKAHSKGKR